MTDRESVVAGLEDSLANNGCGFMDGIGELFAVSGENLQSAIALLKAQEPMESTKHYIPDGKRKSVSFHCGNCLIAIGFGVNYCYNGGRKVKWNDD